MAAPAFADGGPHSLVVNSGTAGLSGDCAACHRAHTAQAADLLKAAMPGLCLTCHDGTAATTNVEDGLQYVPDGSGNPTSAVLGALRGGGFEFALIDTGNPSRLTYSRAGGRATLRG
jgi:predicted CXXCH cytochrome family protein